MDNLRRCCYNGGIKLNGGSHMDTKSFGSYLAELRRAKKLTQKEVADRLYVSDKTVSRWETDRSLPELSLVPALADLLEVSADELLRQGLLQSSPDEEENGGTNAMAENVAQIACKKFNRNGLIALLTFLLVPVFTICLFIVPARKDVIHESPKISNKLASEVLPTIIIGTAILLIIGAVLYMVSLYLTQSRHIRECGAPENVRRSYQDRLFARFVLYFGIIGFVVLLLTGLLLPAIAVIAVVLVCVLIIRSRRA